MKKAVAILVLLAVLVSVSGKTIVWSWYKANADYVAKTLCENKAKPKSTCNGKCYLAKQLKKAEGETKHAPALPQSLKEVKETEGNTKTAFTFELSPATQQVVVAFIYNPIGSSNTTTPLLRPPIA